MFCNATAIIAAILAGITGPVQALWPTLQVHADEELEVNWSDLPLLSLYPTEERSDPEAYNDFATALFHKELGLRFELRVPGTPATLKCIPALNAIVTALQANPTLGGLVQSIEVETLTFATAHVGAGVASGAAMELVIRYQTT